MQTIFRASLVALVGCTLLSFDSASAFGQEQPASTSPPVVEPAAASTQPANALAPPTNIVVKDRPNDAGNGLIVTWDLSPDDTPDANPRRVTRYEVFRRDNKPPKQEEEGGEAPTAEPSEFKLIGEVTYQQRTFEDQNTERGVLYWYQVVAVGPEGQRSAPLELTDGVTPVLQYFNRNRTWLLILLLIVGGSVVYFIETARRGKQLWVRPIPGLDAVSEAVGRATEMGRSCLFVPGIQDINDIQTITGITILARVARLVAEYNAQLEVPTARTLVMTTARETVQAAYLAAGRPDAYREDNIYYLTDEQFGYVAGVTGRMVRERPAACFYMGSFFAESLIFAETGNSIGAIQVAGTAQPSQLPFFVAACDYTLIGEEFFAASAYLSGEPQQLGSLKGQDVGKVLGAVLLIVAVGLATLAVFVDQPSIAAASEFVRDNILGEKGFLP